MKRVKGYINRKSMLYRTGVEYGDFTINHILGCSHGCQYPCYAFLLKKRFGQVKTYDEWVQPYLVSNSLELLDKEIPKLKNQIKYVHLSFTTDPFMYEYEEIKEMSLKIIDKINKNGIKCTVLTKGILPIELINYSKKNEYGITLVSLDEDYRKRYEPGASPYKERISALKKIHDKGFKTWVSIEPYPTPNIINQDLNKILEKISFVDTIIFGRTNYNKVISEYKDNKKFYNSQAKIVIDYCKENNIKCIIKKKTITKQ